MSSNTTAEERVYPSYRWIVLLLMVVTFVATFFIRFIWNPLIPIVSPELGLSAAQAGSYVSAFYIGYIITQIPGGLLADRLGVRVVIAASLVIEGLATFGMGYIDAYETGFALRVVTGLGAGAVYGACARALFEWFPAKERGTAFGIMLGAPAAGIVLSSLLAPPLNDAVGWQGVFKVAGIIAIVLGIIMAIFVRSQKTETKESMFAGFKVVFSNKDLALTACAGFCLMWVELGTATWTIAYAKSLGYTVAQAASVLLIYGFGGIIAPFLSGLLSDRIGHRKWILVGSLLLLAPVTVLFGAQSDLAMLRLMGFIFGFVSYLSNPHLTVLVSQFAGRTWAGLANGASNVIFQLASIIGPFILGIILDVTDSYTWVWWVMAIFPILGVLLILAVNADRQGDDEPATLAKV